MVEIRKPMLVKEAIAQVMAHAKKMPIIEVALSESYGYILAEPIIAKHDVPSFANSPYDGFAIRSAHSANASGENRIKFRVIDHIGAGQVSAYTIHNDEAVRIMTGAPLPIGADAVVMLEQTIEDGQTFTIRKPFLPNENVSLQGADAVRGDVLIEQHTLIHPGTIALLATFGYTRVRVYQKPTVGIICTGTELLEVHEALQHGKIRNSNGPMIRAQLERMHITAREYGILPDNLEGCLAVVRQMMEEVDCIISTGGVSVGDFDYLPAIYEHIGAHVLFNKVAMRPGSVTTVAVANDKLLFGLSGNPSACYTGFELFARPALQQMMGNTQCYLPRIKAVLGEDIVKPNPFTRFIRSVLTWEEGVATVVPAGFNKSNAVTAIARANAIIVLPASTRSFLKGDTVDVLQLGVEQGVATWQL